MTPDEKRSTQVLIVDDDAAVRGIVAKILSNGACRCLLAASASEALQLLRRESVDVVFVDVQMPIMTGLDLADHLRSEHPDVAMVMLTGMTEYETVVSAMQAGVADFVQKPFKNADLIKAFERALERRQTRVKARRASELEREVAKQSEELGHSLSGAAAIAAVVDALLLALRGRNEAAAARAYRVAELSVRIGQSLELSAAELDVLRNAALLHEIGQLAMPDSALVNGEAMSSAVHPALRRCPQLGHDIISRIPGLAECARGILAHREHFDGSGFPLGLVGTAIPLAGRVIAVADAHDDLTHAGPQRPAHSTHEAIALIERDASVRFDPTVVTGLLMVAGEPLDEGLMIDDVASPAVNRV